MKGLRIAPIARIATALLGAALLLGGAQADELRRGTGAPMRLGDNPDVRPEVAIVIDDLGLDWARFRASNQLPMPVTLAFLPYGAHAQAMLDAADPRHDVLLHLPMEPESRRSEAGPDMVPKGTGTEVRAALERNLSKLRGYRGVSNHTGSLATADGPTMRTVLRELGARDLFFLDSATTPRSVSRFLGERTGTTVIEGTLFLDGDLGRGGSAHVARQLAMLEAIARRNGSAIGIGHPYPSTILALNEWAEEARLRVRFVTAGELAEAAQPGAPQARLD